ncbi:hypothetical protein [Gymnodinialimonas sp. 57CJ19]|uniref:hypothetical protein n=1 Tax=Gymnodinialimonas sp. 57CJ19 TaxID=3138498 RepID=UPI0031344BA0
MDTIFDTPHLKAFTAAAAFGALVASTSLATAQGAAVDADGDGMVSFTELLIVMPSLSEAEFMALDADGDTLLNSEEIEAAQEAGLLPVE